MLRNHKKSQKRQSQIQNNLSQMKMELMNKKIQTINKKKVILKMFNWRKLNNENIYSDQIIKYVNI